MPITDKLRRIADLFVDTSDIAPPEPQPTPASVGGDTTMDDLDKKLAEIERKSKAIGTSPQTAPAAPQTPPKTIAEVVRQSAGPNLDEITVSAESTAGALLPDGAVDVGAIYAAAKLPTVSFTAEQTLEMLEKLPTNLPIEIKRQMMQAMLLTMGASMGASAETIVADASRKLAALAAYTSDLQRVTADRMQYAEEEIKTLEARIEEQRQIIANSRVQVESVQKQCEQVADHLDDILEFFSLDTAGSKYA
jgi:hypothetical protein